MHIILIPGGAGPRDSHINPHSSTEYRCQAGLALWRRGGYDRIVVSGFVSPMMKDWLVARGVLASQILVEHQSSDTFTNIKYTMELLHEAGIEKFTMTAVSHWTHLNRIWLTFRLGYGMRITTHRARYRIHVGTFMWECAAFVYHCLDRRGTGWLARSNRARRNRLTKG